MSELAVTNNLPATIDNIIADSSAKYVSTVSQYKWGLIPDSQLHAAKLALTKSDYIMKVACNDVEAVQDALIKAAVLGVDLTEGKRQGWLIPRKSQQKDSKGNYITKIFLQVGYKGVEAIHQEMGVIDRLSIQVVRENDAFDWSGDDAEKPTHNADWFKNVEQRGPIKGAYAITYYPDKSTSTVVAPISQIFEKHRDRSDSWKTYQDKKKKNQYAYPPPWVTDEEEMVKKTMAYIASKQWPANIRDEGTSSRILETLHEVDVSDYSLAYNAEHKKAFEDIVGNGDSLGYWLLQRRVEIEVFAALFGDHVRQIPKGGGRMKEKAKMSEMGKTGNELLNNIYKALADRDEGLLLESTEGMLVITEKMLKAVFTEEQAKTYTEIMTKPEAA